MTTEGGVSEWIVSHLHHFILSTIFSHFKSVMTELAVIRELNHNVLPLSKYKMFFDTMTV